MSISTDVSYTGLLRLDTWWINEDEDLAALIFKHRQN